jgi:CDP-paratose synthetase
MINIVITGASGFLGTALIKRLHNDGINVIALKKRRMNRRVPTDYIGEYVYYDYVEELKYLVNWTKVHAIVHLATSYGRNNKTELEECNLELPLRLLSLANNNHISFFLNADSFFSDVPDQYSYLTDYRTSKRNFREQAKNICVNTQISFINLRIFHMYGPNDNDGKFVYEMARKMKNNIAEIDLTNGSHLRDFIYIDDVVSAFACVLANSNKFRSGFTNLDVCSNSKTSIKQFLLKMKAIYGSTTKLNFGALKTRKGEEYLEKIPSDNSDLLNLGWTINYPLDRGLKEMRLLNEL